MINPETLQIVGIQQTRRR